MASQAYYIITGTTDATSCWAGFLDGLKWEFQGVCNERGKAVAKASDFAISPGVLAVLVVTYDPEKSPEVVYYYGPRIGGKLSDYVFDWKLRQDIAYLLAYAAVNHHLASPN